MKAEDRELITLLGKWRQRMKRSDYLSSSLVWLGSSSLPHSTKKLNNKWWVNGIPTNRDIDTGSFHHEDLKLDDQMYTGWCGETLKVIFVIGLNYVLETRDSPSSKFYRE